MFTNTDDSLPQNKNSFLKMLLRSKVRDLSTIIFWLLSVGRVVEGSVNGEKKNEVGMESLSGSDGG